MNKEQENNQEIDENPFEGFNLLKDNALSAPEKTTKTKKEKVVKEEVVSPQPSSEEIKDKKVEEALKLAELEAKEIASKKESSKEKEKVEEVEENKELTEEIEEETSGSLKPFIEHFANKGVLDFDFEKDEFEDSDEGLEKIVDKTINSRVEKGINSYKESFPEDAQKFLEFIENGGNPKDFHRLYYQESTFGDIKIEGDESTQKYVIREGLIAAGWDDEDEINDEIQLYEDAGKLESKASSHLKRLQKLELDNKTLLVEAQKKYAEEQKELKKQEWDSFKKGLFEKEEISGFKFSPKMKEDLWDYMTKVVDKKQGLTQYQKDSQEKGAESRYIFAYLMKNNWDASKLEKELKNKVVSGIKKKLSNYTDSRNKIKSGVSKEEKQEGNSFAGFRKIAI